MKNDVHEGPAIAQILNFINDHDGIRYALDKALAFIGEGKGLLSTFPESPARDALYAIADFVIARSQ